MSDFCHGWMISDVTGACLMERLYAVTVDGATYATDWRASNPTFDRIGQVWKRVDGTPENAEYIGRYPLPALLAD